MGESNDTLAISDYSKAQGSDTVVPVKTTDHPFMFKGDVDISPDHRLSVRYDRTVNTSFNKSQYVRPWSVTTSLNPEGYVFPPRPEPENSRRGDSEKTVDLRVGKTFRLGARLSATVFWEMFNALNCENFTSYDGQLESPSFGPPTAAGDMRRHQLGLRVDF